MFSNDMAWLAVKAFKCLEIPVEGAVRVGGGWVSDGERVSESVCLFVCVLGLSQYQNYDFDTIPAKISRYPILTIRYHKYDTIPQIRYDTGIFIYDSNKQNICKVPFFTSLFLPSFLNT